MMQGSVPGGSVRCSECKSFKAFHACDCNNEVRMYCGGCMGSHLATSGSHILKILSPDSPNSAHSVEPAMTQQERCSLCKSRPAEMICTCTSPSTRLCGKCTKPHMQGDPISKHDIHNVNVANFLATPALVESFEVRKERAKTVITKVSAVSTDLQTAKKKVSDMMKKLREKLLDLEKKATDHIDEDLRVCSSTIEKTKGEVRDHIYENKYQSSDAFVQSIWDTDEIPNPVDFSSASFLGALEEELQHYIMESTGAVGRFLPCVQPLSLSLYSLGQRCWQPQMQLSEEIYIDAGSSLVKIDEKSVFVCGGGVQRASTAFMINCFDGMVKKLSQMNTRRGFAGCWLHSSRVYIFGGHRHITLRGCEVYSLATLKWSKLANMLQVREKFNPCEMEEELYLAGASVPSKLEIFNFSSQSFRQVEVDIPAAVTSLLLPYHSGLLLIQDQKQYYISARSIIPQVDRRVPIPYSTLPPTIAGDSVYVLDSNRKLVRFDLDGEGYDSLET